MSVIKLKKRVTEYKYIATDYECDNCGKIQKGSETPEDWYSFSSSHRGWGNDSIDSYENYDICSKECYLSKLKHCLKDLENYQDSSNIDGKSYSFCKKMVQDLEKPNDIEHERKIHDEVLKAMIPLVMTADDYLKDLIKAVAKGEIPHLYIKY